MLIARQIKSFFHMTQNLIFFEIPICESRADLLYVQPPMPYETTLKPGIHLFEVKMPKDLDRQRLRRQLRSYTGIVDYVWLIGVDKVLESDPEQTGIISFNSDRCRITVIKNAKSNDPGLDVLLRQELLNRLAKDLRNKYDHVCDMARTNHRSKASRVMIQQKLQD